MTMNIIIENPEHSPYSGEVYTMCFAEGAAIRSENDILVNTTDILPGDRKEFLLWKDRYIVVVEK